MEATGVIMIFVSKGYFKSGNCLREAKCTLEKRKPIVLMHDPNGAPLETLKEDECPEDHEGVLMRGPIFDGREVIEWHRIKDFQIISLKLLAYQLLLGCPSDKNTWDKHLGTEISTDRQIFLPGEVSRLKLAFPAPVLLFVSANNRGAKETAALLQKGMVGLSIISETPTQFSSRRRVAKTSAKGISQLVGSGRNLLTDLVAAKDASMGGAAGASATETASGEGNNVTHMLLYLNDETFVGPEGAVLADEVRAAQHQP